MYRVNLLMFVVLLVLAGCGDQAKEDATLDARLSAQAAEENAKAAQSPFGSVEARDHQDKAARIEAEAFEARQRLAARGDTSAQFNLGRMYAEGIGIRKDVVLAYAWLSVTKESYAIKLRDRLVSNMNSAEIAEGQLLSNQWKQGNILKRQ